MTEREAKLYLAMLIKPDSNATELHRLSGVIRTKTYETLHQMVSRGYCLERVSGRTRYYRAVPPMMISEILSNTWAKEIDARNRMAAQVFGELDKVFKQSNQNNQSLDFIVNVSIEIVAEAQISVTWAEEIGYPDIIDWNAAFDDLMTGQPYEITVQVTNLGALALDVDDVRELRVPMEEGWNFISINVIPRDEDLWVREEGPDVVRMLEQLRIDEESHHVILFKDERGRFYAPALGFNGIPYWNLAEGFQVKVDEDVEAVWVGVPIPADADIPIDPGWNLIAYYPEYDLDAGAPDFYVVSPIIDNVEIAKDEDGNFMVPAFRFSNMPPWAETQGYQIKIDADDVVVLNYPEEQDAAGHYLALWNAKDASAGVYLVQMEASNGFHAVRKSTLIK